MIRTLPLICTDCGKEFKPEQVIYYRDDFMAKEIKDVKFVCADCIKAWQDKWQLEKAVFEEKDCVLTVALTLKDGTVFERLDCTPLQDTMVVSDGMDLLDMPEEAQKELFKRYTEWDLQRKAHMLKDCIFEDEFMVTRVTCATYGGESFEKLAFRINVRGELETERPVPDYIATQIVENYNLYKAQEELSQIVPQKEN